MAEFSFIEILLTAGFSLLGGVTLFMLARMVSGQDKHREAFNKLVLSVDRLATNMTNLQQEQKEIKSDVKSLKESVGRHDFMLEHWQKKEE